LSSRTQCNGDPGSESHDLLLKHKDNPLAAWVYILASRPYETLYTGVTTDLARRIYEHREGLIEGFSERYGVKSLVWYETHHEIDSAIKREKQIKRWRRQWKFDLIEQMNSDWTDLYRTLNQ
jgi:putative endonuclease